MAEHSRAVFLPTGVVTYSSPPPGITTNVAVAAVSTSSSVILAVTAPM